MKYSRQREKILNKLIEYRVHPSAEQLYWKLVEDGEKIGLATVYRNLNYLAEAGVIKRFQTFEKHERFDNIDDKGFKTVNYEVMAEGLCADCQKEGEK